MHLATNDDCTGVLESLLQRPSSMCTSSESLSCKESKPTETVILVRDGDGETSDVDEHENLIGGDERQCRICFESGGGELIAPCDCKGTQKYVHRSCLDHWRSIKEGFAFAHCTECRADFHLRANMLSRRWWLKLKFQLLVFLDHVMIFIVVMLVVALLCLLAYKFFGEELRDMFCYDDNHVVFYALAAMSIIMMGLIFGFFIAMICGHKITERHNHVLAKRELTKEYMVVNREDNGDPPGLDPDQITELRELGLY
ncbi:uncharacterized protein LOC116264505 [Nymphaea colorata]|nr:uncharacterized protein LOC116264505 [Nymphaea colorata]